MKLLKINTDNEIVGSGSAHRTNVANVNENFETLANAINSKKAEAPVKEKSAVVASAVSDAKDEKDVVKQFNALLSSLRAAGIIAK